MERLELATVLAQTESASEWAAGFEAGESAAGSESVARYGQEMNNTLKIVSSARIGSKRLCCPNVAK